VTICFGTSQNEVGTFWQTELVKMFGAGADSEEEFWILDPVGSVVLKPDTHNRYNCSIGKKVRGLIEV